MVFARMMESLTTQFKALDILAFLDVSLRSIKHISVTGALPLANWQNVVRQIAIRIVYGVVCMNFWVNNPVSPPFLLIIDKVENKVDGKTDNDGGNRIQPNNDHDY
jgi:hypothetical protein